MAKFKQGDVVVPDDAHHDTCKRMRPHWMELNIVMVSEKGGTPCYTVEDMNGDLIKGFALGDNEDYPVAIVFKLKGTKG